MIDLREFSYALPSVTQWHTARGPSVGVDAVYRDNVTEMEVAVRDAKETFPIGSISFYALIDGHYIGVTCGRAPHPSGRAGPVPSDR